MNNENPFMGLGVALVTPFTANGNIDWEKFAELIEFQIENGTDYLCILGTTAEATGLAVGMLALVISFVSVLVVCCIGF